VSVFREKTNGIEKYIVNHVYFLFGWLPIVEHLPLLSRGQIPLT